jgi:hypothetical protein
LECVSIEDDDRADDKVSDLDLTGGGNDFLMMMMMMGGIMTAALMI